MLPGRELIAQNGEGGSFKMLIQEHKRFSDVGSFKVETKSTMPFTSQALKNSISTEYVVNLNDPESWREHYAQCSQW